jgi:hypothetical protein
MEKRIELIRFYVSPEENSIIHAKFRASTHRTFASYIRDVTLQNPVTVRYRSQSLDEFLSLAIGIKNELQSTNKGFLAAVHRLQELSPDAESRAAVEFFSAEAFSISRKIDEIKEFLITTYDQCMQK